MANYGNYVVIAKTDVDEIEHMVGPFSSERAADRWIGRNGERKPLNKLTLGELARCCHRTTLKSTWKAMRNKRHA